jgi:hypothetical protein
MHQAIARISRNRREIFQIARAGEFVALAHRAVRRGIGQQQSDYGIVI